MKGILTKAQIDYVLFHFNLVVKSDTDFAKYFHFCGSENVSIPEKKIVFTCLEEPFDIDKVKWIDNIPMLFPNAEKNIMYSMEGSNLIFHHDILKSVFYLLSGYQEYVSVEKDFLGRFPWDASLQKKLNITHKPVVNYYFEIMRKGIEEFLASLQKEVIKKKTFKNFAFFLTHDIDYIDYYTFERLLYKIKELTGLVHSYYPFLVNLKHIFRTVIELMKFGKKQNPSWSFDFLRQLEKKYGFRSAFYFLHKDVKYKDSRYSFSEQRIKDLFQYVKKENCEIGIHGSVRSVNNFAVARKHLKSLQENSGTYIRGNRQHKLLYQLPQTALMHESMGLKYDTTLCFAQHEGFRNSFCLPFKPFDFENNRTIDIWEVPLQVMDVTLFHYRGLKPDLALEVIKNLIIEIKKFNGVFTLLWHNDFFDEDRFPGVKKFYERLIEYIYEEKPESLLGHEIIERCSES